MKQVLSFEQMKHLQELGLYHIYTLPDILDKLPCFIGNEVLTIKKFADSYTCLYVESYTRSIGNITEGKELIDSAYEMLCWCIENGYVKVWKGEITMGFTTPCFIRKNTQELRRGLEELGYSHGKPKYYADDDNKYDFIMCHNGKFFLLSQKNHVIKNGHPLKKYGSIDCGTNEELFLAIAALRDDTDNNQLFTNGKGDWGIYRDGSDGGLSGMDFYGMPNDFNLSYYHKATVNELIEHFKIKEEQ